MTNKQILVLNKIVEITDAITEVAFAGLYPEAIRSIGQRYPAVIVRDGDEDAPQYNAGQQVIYNYAVDVILHPQRPASPDEMSWCRIRS